MEETDSEGEFDFDLLQRPIAGLSLKRFGEKNAFDVEVNARISRSGIRHIRFGSVLS